MFVKIIDESRVGTSQGVSTSTSGKDGTRVGAGASEARVRLRRRRRATKTSDSNGTPTSMVVNGTKIDEGEDVIVTLRRERAMCFVSLDDIEFNDEYDVAFDVFGTSKEQKWATGEVKRDEFGDFAMTMYQPKHAPHARALSTEGERTPKTSDLILEFSLVTGSEEDGSRRCLTARVAISLASLRSKRTVVGETSAILPAIDEHSDHSYYGMINALKQRSKFLWGSSPGSDYHFHNLALLTRMRQSYTSMLEHEEYPIDHKKMTWFDASLRLGVGMGLGAVLGLGLGVGVIANGLRSVKNLGSGSKKLSAE